MKVIQNIVRHHFGKAFILGAILIVVFSRIAPQGPDAPAPTLMEFLIFLLAVILLGVGALGTIQFIIRDRD